MRGTPENGVPLFLFREEADMEISAIRKRAPLVHCLTNYVTANDCANLLLAIGASPVMADEPAETEEITALASSLVINIGTLSTHTLDAMRLSARQAAGRGLPTVLDPVGAGASRLRTEAAQEFLAGGGITCVRGNVSEMRALAGISFSTRGVDASREDLVEERNLAAAVSLTQQLADRTGSIVAVSGAIDVISGHGRTALVRNGHPAMTRITGSGCMETALLGAFLGSGAEDQFAAVVMGMAAFGLCGEIAVAALQPGEGNASLRNRLIDAVCNLDDETFIRMAKIEYC